MAIVGCDKLVAMSETLDNAPDPVVERIQERLLALGKSERGAAEEAGLSASGIRNIREGKSNSPRLDTIRKLARVLDTTPEWLAFGLKSGAGLGQAQPFGEIIADAAFSEILKLPEPATGPDEPKVISPPRATPARYAGLVEAGSFRAVEDFEDDPDREPLWTLADREFPDQPLVFFEAVGDSMNALKPRGIVAGDQLVCLDFEGLRGALPIRDGLVVVVEQTLDGGHHRERSVKQIELYEDRVEFCPRSTTKRHKPIVTPKVIHGDPSEEDGKQVRVLAVVRGVFNDMTRL